jgi:hypothetical protein
MNISQYEITTISGFFDFHEAYQMDEKPIFAKNYSWTYR